MRMLYLLYIDLSYNRTFRVKECADAMLLTHAWAVDEPGPIPAAPSSQGLPDLHKFVHRAQLHAVQIWASSKH
jgi:hypothetical protein